MCENVWECVTPRVDVTKPKCGHKQHDIDHTHAVVFLLSHHSCDHKQTKNISSAKTKRIIRMITPFTSDDTESTVTTSPR